MKKLSTFFFIICFTLSSIAQPPEKMNYQAVIRNSSNELIANQEVTIKISIRMNASDGLVVYTETQSVTTNANGLVSLEVGNEAGFGNINWSNGEYYIQIEADPTGGTNFTITGVSQLLSVPYALHSKTTSQTVTETDPVYSLSVASGITSTNIGNWNDAFGWGNHSAAGYLTAFTESDPIFSSHSAYSITNNHIETWDSAYSWGNHAEMGYLTSISAENDPVFTASDAYGITSTNISNWNTAYGWGDHSTAGYLTTFTETDPDFNASAANSISNTNISNWNTAYSWGNHATQGYLTSFSETDPYSVHLTGTQTIGGEKTFNSRTNILQLEISPVNTGNRYGYIDIHGDNTYTDYALRLIRNNTGVNTESWLKHRGTGALYIAAEDAGKIGLRTNGNTRMFIDSNGEIGVGTTAPGAKFEVNSAGYSGDILFQVKDNAGAPVFTVYPDAVEVSVPDDGTTKANRHGSFIVSGRHDKDKATIPITRITKENYFIGHNIGTAITGKKNSVMGYEAGKSITSAYNNVFLGFEAGKDLTTGDYNVLIGNQAGLSANSNWAVVLGYASGQFAGGGSVIIGGNAGINRSGSSNVIIGYGAGGIQSAGGNNVFLGSYAGYNETGSSKLYIENSATSSPLIYGDFSSDYITVNGHFTVESNYASYSGIFRNTGNSTTRTGISIQCGTDDNSGTNTMIRFANGSNATVGYIRSSGGVVSYGTKSYTPGKSSISKFDKNANSILNEIDVMYFNPSEKINNTIVGFNGKQMMDLIPGSTFYDEETDEYYTDKSALVPILTKAIQEQQMKIEEIEELKKEIEELKQMVIQLTKE